MKEPSDARKRTVALQERAIRFSTNVNRSYPAGAMNYPSEVVWGQLIRAADGASNNLVEADNGSTDADFLNKMRTALREAKESKADELCAIFSTIITNMEKRLALRKTKRARN